MAEQKVMRRLAAILAADIAGYRCQPLLRAPALEHDGRFVCLRVAQDFEQPPALVRGP